MADISFFDPKKEAEVRRKRLLAEQLMKQGEQTPNEVVSGIVVKKSPLEGLVKALQTGVGGYQAGQADKIQTEDTTQKQKALADAVAQYGTDPQAAAQMLMQSPATSDVGMKIYMDDIKRKQDLELAQAGYAREDAQFEKEAALKRELAAMRQNGGGVPTVDPDTGEITQGYSNKPLPVGALKLQNEAIDAIGAAGGTSDLSQSLISQVDSGQLELSPVSNFLNSARNFAGLSNDQSVNFANMKTSLEKLRNDTLRLNKGVQTEGDAVRAMNEVLQSVNDPKVFRAAMEKLNAVNDRAAELQKLQVNNIRGNYNAAPMSFDAINALPSPVPQGQSRQSAAPQTDIRAKLQAAGVPPERIDAYLRAKGQ